MKRLLALIFLFASAAHADVHVLFVGDSLTYFNEMPWMLEQIATSRGTPLRASFSGHSGATIRQDWQEGKALRAIREGRYDFVVLQAQSSEIIRVPEETTRYAKLLDQEIRKSKAKTIVFLTWATLADPGPTQEQYTTRYRELARQLSAPVAPVGIAWENVRARSIELFNSSGRHPNLPGSYLVACVFYGTLTDRTPVGATYTFNVHYDIPDSYRYSLEHEKLDVQTAEIIQRAAWDAVSGENQR